MFEENDSRKVFLSVLGVAILIVAVVGISYAAFSFTTTTQPQDNTISTGTITMSYTEPSAGLTLSDELPMETGSGKTRPETFDFSVHTKATGKVSIPYEINMISTFTTADGTYQPLANSEVMVYLESKASTAAESSYAQVLAATKVSGLTASAYASKSGRTGALKLYNTTDSYTAANGGEKTTDYRLRMWISSDVDSSKFQSASYKYVLKVNVDSAVKPLGQ